MTTREASSFPRYEADEIPALPVALGLGVQSAILAITPIALFPIVLAQSVGASDEFSDWAVFAMLVVNGATTIAQAYRFGPIGSGMLIVSYPSPTTIPFCIVALQQGGPTTLAALIVVYGAMQILLSMRMAVLRRIFTPAISGALLILLLLSLIPVLFRNLGDAPADAPAFSSPLCILVAFVVMVGFLIRGPNNWRVWASIIGIAAGSAVAVATGIFDFGPVMGAPAIGLPQEGWPGISFTLDTSFWSMLPVFLFLSVVAVLQGNSINLATQRVSWRNARAIDYRRVQGSMLGAGLANIVAGLAAVMPITIGPRGVAFTQQTGCGSRYIGVITGVLLIVVAFFPKVWSLLLGIPAPVVAIYVLVLIGPLVVEGMKLIVQDAPDYRISLVVGTAIVFGLGLQMGLVSLPVGEIWEDVLQKALTGGGAILVLLTMYAEFRRHRRQQIRVDLRMDELPKLHQFIEQFSFRHGWSAQMTTRLQAVTEETMQILLDGREGEDDQQPNRLSVEAVGLGQVAELEFQSVAGGEDNVEDRLALLSQQMPLGSESEMPNLETLVQRDAALRLLKYYAASVNHKQYFDVEVITVRVMPPTG